MLRQADRRPGLLEAVNARLPDPRDGRYVRHDQLTLLRQRVYALCHGYEDLNDHNQLRGDLALQTATEQDQVLGSSPTLCRLENRMGREAAISIHQVLVEQFIASFAEPPEKLILDFDATDDRVHGFQEGRFFHGYYDACCFLPLYVFCGDQLLVSYLRPGKIDGTRHAWAILALLVKRLRQTWPAVRIILQADSGFCRHRMLRWCERHGVSYIVGLACNQRLQRLIEADFAKVEQRFQATREKQRHFIDLRYSAKSWGRRRAVIARLEVTTQGRNPRFIVTNLNGDARQLYDQVYCARGEMENRIKEQQPGLFADRTSAHQWWTHQFRLLLSSLGYKQWGKGKVYLESRKYPLHSPSSGLTTWLHPTIANSAQNQRADEISRPGWFPFIIRSNPRKRAQKCVNDQHGVQRKCIGAIWKRWQPDAEDRFVWNVIIDQKTINFDMK